MLSMIFGKKKKKVLMIDDDVKVLSMYEQILSVNNDVFEVVLAYNKAEFLEKIEKVDAVVTDYHMSDVTGLNFDQTLKICNMNKKPLLLITGDIAPYYQNQLSKPVSGKMLRRNIENMLNRGFVRAEAPKRPAA